MVPLSTRTLHYNSTLLYTIINIRAHRWGSWMAMRCWCSDYRNGCEPSIHESLLLLTLGAGSRPLQMVELWTPGPITTQPNIQHSTETDAFICFINGGKCGTSELSNKITLR